MLTYSIEIFYTPGENLVSADVLSRALLQDNEDKISKNEGILMNELRDAMPISKCGLARLQTATSIDSG